MGNLERSLELVNNFGPRFQTLRDLALKEGTPCLAIDIKRVNQAYDEIARNMPNVKIYFAVKACPIKEVLIALFKKGSYFDAASRGEIELLLSLGVSGNRISYGNTIKKKKDIAFAYRNGVRIFTSDSEQDLDKIAECAPNSKVNIRIQVKCEGADLGLEKKFGCHDKMAFGLAIHAKKIGLIPYGISFHVGSQQRDVGQWDDALTNVKYFFDYLPDEGVELKCINLGGGLPADYSDKTDSVGDYCRAIMGYLEDDFDLSEVEIMIEPGRALVANAGIIVTEVVNVTKKKTAAKDSWVYFDVGYYNGLNEMAHIEFAIYYEGSESENEDKDWHDVTIAGPSCCSLDMSPEEFYYNAPKRLKEGDIAIIMSAGVYTWSLQTQGFNSSDPLKLVILPDDDI